MIEPLDNSYSIIIFVMQWCCPDHEVNEIYGDEYRKAVYVSTLAKNQSETPKLYSSLKENPIQHRHSFKQLPVENSLVSHPSFLPPLQAAKVRNDHLGRQVEQRKIIVWNHTNNLIQRTEVLKQTYVVKNNELRILSQQIDQHFG